LDLTRISHQLSTVAADPGMAAALRSIGLLDILSSMPAGPYETYIFTLGANGYVRMHRLAKKPGEKRGQKESKIIISNNSFSGALE
jgi:hypothetical protein